MPASPEDLILARQDRAGIITLNRPQQRHALTTAMLTRMREVLDRWQDDPGVELVLIEASGHDGFCGGGDLGALCKGPVPDTETARQFWREGARLAATIARARKPVITLIDGLAAGSGVGLTAHATYRVVTENARLALPETAIGVVPDFALTWLLARSAGALGVYLVLSGQPLDAAGAIQAGLADGLIPAHRIGDLRARLVSTYGGVPERILNSFVAPAGVSQLAPDLPVITAAFGASTLEDMLALLETQGDTGKRMAQALSSRSPMALKLALTLMQRVQGCKTIEDALKQEHRVLNRLFQFGELQEGVRARLIEGNRSPAWTFSSLAEVDPTLIASVFSPMLPGEDLRLAD